MKIFLMNITFDLKLTYSLKMRKNLRMIGIQLNNLVIKKVSYGFLNPAHQAVARVLE